MLVPPRPSLDDAGNGFFVNAKCVRKHLVCHLSKNVTLSDFGNLRVCKDGHAMRRASGIPALSDHVVNVVSLGSHKKMRRITANPIVALVKDKKSVSDIPVRQLIGHPVRTFLGAKKVNMPVSCVFKHWSEPRPTVIGAEIFVHSLPEFLYALCAKFGRLIVFSCAHDASPKSDWVGRLGLGHSLSRPQLSYRA